MSRMREGGGRDRRVGGSFAISMEVLKLWNTLDDALRMLC